MLWFGVFPILIGIAGVFALAAPEACRYDFDFD